MRSSCQNVLLTDGTVCVMRDESELRLAGKCRIEHFIAVGGMGAVWTTP
jgi:hypothetical protein